MPALRPAPCSLPFHMFFPFGCGAGFVAETVSFAEGGGDTKSERGGQEKRLEGQQLLFRKARGICVGQDHQGRREVSALLIVRTSSCDQPRQCLKHNQRLYSIR